MTASNEDRTVWHLKGTSGQYAGTDFTLGEEVIWLGRAAPGTPNTPAHILFEDQSVSRVHGALAWAPEYKSYVFHHRSQTNPTFVNGKNLTEPKLLEPGDEISFGGQTFRYELARSITPDRTAETIAPTTRAPIPIGSPPIPAESSSERTLGLESEKDREAPKPLIKLDWGQSTSEGPSSAEPKPMAETSDDSDSPPLLSLRREPSHGAPVLSPRDEPHEELLAEAPSLLPRAEPTVEAIPAIPAVPAKAAPLNIGFRGRGQSMLLSAERFVKLCFSPHNTSLEGPLTEGDTTICQIPAKYATDLIFEWDPTTQSVSLRPESSLRTKTRRITSAGDVTLEVTLCNGENSDLNLNDLVTHQHCDCWIAEHPQQEPPTGLASSSESISSVEDLRGLLTVQTGEWQGARITLMAKDGNSLELGPGISIGGYPIPVSDAPLCRIHFLANVPHVEVLEASGGQYVSINGELLFPGSSRPLCSGSGLFLGQLMLYWTQPHLQSRLVRYKLESRGQNFPLSRSRVRIGTASHCEIVLEGANLAEEVGVISFTERGFHYHHSDPVHPAQVDGQPLAAHQQATIQEGSVLRLGSDCLLELKAK